MRTWCNETNFVIPRGPRVNVITKISGMLYLFSAIGDVPAKIRNIQLHETQTSLLHLVIKLLLLYPPSTLKSETTVLYQWNHRRIPVIRLSWLLWLGLKC